MERKKKMVVRNMVVRNNELKRIICLAEEKAREYNHSPMNSGHILLAVEEAEYHGAFEKLFNKTSFREQIRQKFKKANPPRSTLTIVPEHPKKNRGRVEKRNEKSL